MHQPHDVDAVPPQPDPDDLLWTKLYAPVRPTSFVDRPGVRDLLREGFGRGDLTLVSAPAGFGKSVLLADACETSGRATAWLSLDGDDNDPVRFWRHVAAALDEAIGESGRCVDGIDSAVRGEPERLGVRAATALRRALSGAELEAVLVLDDYHVIVEPSLHESVRHLLDHAPSGLAVALATRADPPLQLARRRAQGRLTEVRAADLRFSADESARLLRMVAGEGLDTQVVAALTDRTEGWVAGLHLAGLSLGGVADVEAFAAAFSGQHRFVMDYLTEEVLERQEPAVREFLLSTSVLDRLSGPLCDAVTGRADSREMLEAIERSNLFLVALDDVREWWRYHHLFGDLLRARLQRQPDEVVHRLHRRAAEWHAAQGHVNEAVRHALAGGDAGRAAQLIERHADEVLLRREGVSLQHWVDQLPADQRDSRRRLVLARARVATYCGRTREAERLLDLAETMAGGDHDPGFRPSAGDVASPLAEPDPMAALLRAFVAHLRGDVDEAASLAADVLEGQDDPGSALSLIARWHLASAPFVRGDTRSARPALEANVADWRAAGASNRAVMAARKVGQIHHATGDLDAALATYRDVLDRDTTSEDPAAGIAHVGLAETSYELGALDAARVHARLGVTLSRDLVYAQALADGLAIVARVHWAEGEHDAALRTMSEAVAVIPSHDVVDLLNPVPARAAELHLLCGDVAAASRWAAGAGMAVAVEPTHERGPAHRAYARLLLARGEHADALSQLDRMRDLAVEQGRRGDVIEIDVFRAAGLAGVGDRDGTFAALAAAVTAATETGHRRVFVDQPEPVPTLLAELGRAPDTGLGPRHRAHLESVLGQSADRRAAAVEPALVVPPTPREIEVLELLAAGLQNKQIAAELYVSQNTVKKHVAHLFDKLTVTTRTAAVTRARELGLLG